MRSAAIADLPSVRLSERAYLPARPGVYFLIHDEQILYIGKAANLRTQMANKIHIRKLVPCVDTLRIARAHRIAWILAPEPLLPADQSNIYFRW